MPIVGTRNVSSDNAATAVVSRDDSFERKRDNIIVYVCLFMISVVFIIILLNPSLADSWPCRTNANKANMTDVNDENTLPGETVKEEKTSTSANLKCKDNVEAGLRSTVGTSIGEQETKLSLQRLLGKVFVKTRPSWLINPRTGRRLEIDCFNEELGLAVEHSGAQHYVFPNAFHKSQQEFEAQVERDRVKEAICRQRGLHFIVVPYTISKPFIEDFLRQKLGELGFRLLSN